MMCANDEYLLGKNNVDFLNWTSGLTRGPHWLFVPQTVASITFSTVGQFRVSDPHTVALLLLCGVNSRDHYRSKCRKTRTFIPGIHSMELIVLAS